MAGGWEEQAVSYRVLLLGLLIWFFWWSVVGVGRYWASVCKKVSVNWNAMLRDYHGGQPAFNIADYTIISN